MISAINRKGYGLTFGLHTRIEARVQHIVDGVHAGNIYVNRNQIGAVVGSQPFGGEGLSGTGPKAGGPHYLRRFRRSAEAGGKLDDGRKVTASELADALPDPTDGGWSARADRVPVLRKLLRGKAADAISAAAATDFGPVDLPGPTGEANTLTLGPRGRVLCLGPDGETLLAQAVQALAAGNAVLAVAPGARRSHCSRCSTRASRLLRSMAGRTRSNRARLGSMWLRFPERRRRSAWFAGCWQNEPGRSFR